MQINSLVIIDIEASSLSPRSYPIEIAWIDLIRGDYDSFLINPGNVNWWKDWSAKSENMHKITLEELQSDGIEPEKAISRLSKLNNRNIFCTAPRWDMSWIIELYRCDHEKPYFAFKDIFLIPLRKLDYQKIDQELLEIATHRAMADVLSIARFIYTYYRSHQLIIQAELDLIESSIH